METTTPPTARPPSAVRLARLFYRGLYQDLLEEVGTPKRAAGEALVYVIGSLAFLGQVDEAGLRFARADGELTGDQRAACRFFLGVSLCRQSSYAEARAHFTENLRQLRLLSLRRRSPVLQFYAHQGLAFYRYFCGRFRGALGAARKAHGASLQQEFVWGKLIATDLMGHALVQTGEVSLGLRHLERARALAERLGNGGTVQALIVAVACYRAQFGLLAPSAAVRELNQLSKSLAFEDTYSHAAVLLELGRQLLLRGRADEARRALNRSCQYIFGSRNRRQGVLLNLRFAMCHYVRGEFEQGLNLLLISSRELQPGIDLALEVEVLGLQEKFHSRLGYGPDLSDRIQRLSRRTQKGIALRMLARKSSADTCLHSPGEDPLGDVVDRVRAQPAEILRSGYLGLLHDSLADKPGGQLIYGDLVPGTLCLLDEGNVEYAAGGVTPTIRKLILTLAKFSPHEISKEELLDEVWGVSFRSLSRDQMIYSAISRLRQLLGGRSAWLEAREEGYALCPGVQVTWGRRQSPAREAITGAPPETAAPFAEERLTELNHRQLKILGWLSREEPITTRLCLKRFRVSEITASRDLSQLHKRGLLRKIGRGRAVSYQSQNVPLPRAAVNNFVEEEIL